MNNYYRPPSFSMFPPVVKNLLIANVLFLLATIIIRDTYNYDITNLLGLHYFLSSKFKIFQLVSYMFLHDTSSFFLQHNLDSLAHIGSNMFALWMFGAVVENYWGPKRFIIFYLVCGIGAAIVQEATWFFYFNNIKESVDTYLATHDQQGVTLLFTKFQDLIDNATTIGASGAIFGILLAFGMLFPNTMVYVFFAIPLKAKYFVIIYGLIELYMGAKSSTGDNVAHFAHLGGLLFGFIMIMYWKRKRTL
jgi:membrane associated rhomboid family serine protease